jgi:hypothetical protein
MFPFLERRIGGVWVVVGVACGLKKTVTYTISTTKRRSLLFFFR